LAARALWLFEPVKVIDNRLAGALFYKPAAYGFALGLAGWCAASCHAGRNASALLFKGRHR
jgi:hypothetical protein